MKIWQTAVKIWCKQQKKTFDPFGKSLVPSSPGVGPDPLSWVQGGIQIYCANACNCTKKNIMNLLNKYRQDCHTKENAV